MIQILEDSNLVADVCAEEFNCLPPHKNFGDVVAVVEDGEIKAFISREMLIHVGTFWVNPTDRNTTKSVKWLKDLIQYAIVHMPKGSSSVVLDQTGKYDKLLKFIGLQPYDGTAYRIDFPD